MTHKDKGIPAQDSKAATSPPINWGSDFSAGAASVVILSFLIIGTLPLAVSTFFVACAGLTVVLGLCVADFVEAAAAAAAAATGGGVGLFRDPLR